MAKESLRELLEYYRDHIHQFNRDWYLACSRHADEIGHMDLQEVRERARADVEAIHAVFLKKSELLWSQVPELTELRNGAPGDIEQAIDFCSIDVRPFRCGYFKAKMYNELKSLNLTEPQKRRIRSLGLAYVEWPGQRREMRELGRLLIVVANADFVAELQKVVESSDIPERRRKARILLDKILNSRMDLRS